MSPKISPQNGAYCTHEAEGSINGMVETWSGRMDCTIPNKVVHSHLRWEKKFYLKTLPMYGSMFLTITNKVKWYKLVSTNLKCKNAVLGILFLTHKEESLGPPYFFSMTLCCSVTILYQFFPLIFCSKSQMQHRKINWSLFLLQGKVWNINSRWQTIFHWTVVTHSCQLVFTRYIC